MNRRGGELRAGPVFGLRPHPFGMPFGHRRPSARPHGQNRRASEHANERTNAQVLQPQPRQELPDNLALLACARVRNCTSQGFADTEPLYRKRKQDRQPPGMYALRRQVGAGGRCASSPTPLGAAQP